MPVKKKQSSEAAVREIRRRSRSRFSAEEKIRVVLEGLRGEMSVAELCRREGIASNLYYRWSKDFLEAGKKRLNGDTVREATSEEVKVLRSENRELKEVVAEMTLKNRVQSERLEEDRQQVSSELRSLNKRLDVTPTLNFAEGVLADPSAFWKAAEPTLRRRFQIAVYPNGLVFNGEKFRTVVTSPVFKHLQGFRQAEGQMVSPRGPKGLQTPIDRWFPERPAA